MEAAAPAYFLFTKTSLCATSRTSDLMVKPPCSDLSIIELIVIESAGERGGYREKKRRGQRLVLVKENQLLTRTDSGSADFSLLD